VIANAQQPHQKAMVTSSFGNSHFYDILNLPIYFDKCGGFYDTLGLVLGGKKEACIEDIVLELDLNRLV
jgi:hypothetical protein